MKFNAGCWRRRLVALSLSTNWLTGCTTAGSDISVGVCPPAVGYDQAVREQAAAELQHLSEGSAIEEMLIDYAILREMVAFCGGS